MPGLIAVSEFVEETREDYNSPTTSTFVSRMPQCRQTITSLEEVNLHFTYIYAYVIPQLSQQFEITNFTSFIDFRDRSDGAVRRISNDNASFSSVSSISNRSSSIDRIAFIREASFIEISPRWSSACSNAWAFRDYLPTIPTDTTIGV